MLAKYEEYQNLMTLPIPQLIKILLVITHKLLSIFDIQEYFLHLKICFVNFGRLRRTFCYKEIISVNKSSSSILLAIGE